MHEHARRTSPCIAVCTIDPQTQWCMGCYRTLPEIAQWWKVDDARREEILRDIEHRRGDETPSRDPSASHKG